LRVWSHVLKFVIILPYMSRYDLKRVFHEFLFMENEFSKDSCKEIYDNLSA